MRVLVFLLSLGYCAAASADVYRWVDDEGRVHYGDIPQGEAKRLMLHVPSTNPTRGKAPPSSPPAANDDPGQPTPFHAGKADATASERCTEYRARLNRYQSAQALYRRGADGLNQELSDADRADLITRTQEQASEACARSQAKPATDGRR